MVVVITSQNGPCQNGLKRKKTLEKLKQTALSVFINNNSSLHNSIYYANAYNAYIAITYAY